MNASGVVSDSTSETASVAGNDIEVKIMPSDKATASDTRKPDDGVEPATGLSNIVNPDGDPEKPTRPLKKARTTRTTAKLQSFQPVKGMTVKKLFPDGEYYFGTVEHNEPEPVGRNEEKCWSVLYNDGDREDMTFEEVFKCHTTEQARHEHQEHKENQRIQQMKSKEEREKQQFEKAKTSLLSLPGLVESEILSALKAVGPPFGLQAVIRMIQKKAQDRQWLEPSGERFAPKVGMRVRKMFDGKNFYGTVTKDKEKIVVPGDPPREVMMWEVTFDDGDVDDMDWYELFRYRANRPIQTAPCRGRQLQCLELFSGRGIVTQEFCDRKWKVSSIDNNACSNATLKIDIMSLKPEELEFVPDFIWASPPCHTYSNMAGGKHRNVETESFEMTKEAREHNYFFVKMAEIMHWAKKRHPHLVVVIENPVGTMRSMPLMKDLTDRLGLYCVIVNYCAFGRDDKKPTCLWTNDFGLYSNLAEFKCEKSKCPYSIGVHPISVRTEGKMFNASAIPQPLAEEVAEYVNAKFYQDRIRYKEAAKPNDST